jgi:lactobin A/cerein 7B family class IIb bacteriocin
MKELTEQELISIEGGGSLWLDITRAIGAGAGYVLNAFKWVGENCEPAGMAKC